MRLGWDCPCSRKRKVTANAPYSTDGVGADEIALTRGATEALQALIGGYNGLRQGDAVLYADLDYGARKETVR